MVANIHNMTASFTAIDFETANNSRDSACAVGIVTVEGGIVTDSFYSLIKPPGNYYNYYNTQVHGITAGHTRQSPIFSDLFPAIRQRMEGKLAVAHNAAFDRSVLQKTMGAYSIDYSSLALPYPWECTYKIYKAKGFLPARLDSCCQRLGIRLMHHNALSDAAACAQLFLRHLREADKQPVR